MKIVKTRLPDEESNLWKAYCKSKNISGAHTLRNFILQLITRLYCVTKKNKELLYAIKHEKITEPCKNFYIINKIIRL